MAAIKAVLFDLGGVLVELAGEQHMLSLLEQRMTREELWRRWLQSSAVRAHETGRITSAQFAEDLVVEFEIDISPEEFLAGFKGWLKAPFPGAEALLDDTSRQYITAILSNTSAVHWPIVESMNLHHRVHHVVKSHELGQIKPDRAYFEQALKIIGILPQDTIFFDDNKLNVDGARACDIHAYHVYGAAQARSALCDLGLLEA
jgi:HAD superfamily hydrolase (TIGR01509 family)